MRAEIEGDTDHKRADWAVVFVHGIGQQVPGDTLSRFGRPLVEYADSMDGQSSHVDDTEDTYTLTIDDVGSPRRWLLVEARWDDVVAPPTYAQLLEWMVLVVPWILHSDALLWSGRRPRTPRRPGWWVAFYYAYAWGAKLLWALTRSMLLLISGVIAQLALTVVGLVGLAPVLRGPARRLQRLLIVSVGDSYAYLFDEASWARMEQRLVETIEQARTRAEHITVVTHSQGTAVMHRSLQTPRSPDWVDTWVSLGSGLQKLMVLRTVSTRTLVGWAVLRAAALCCILATVPFWGLVRDPVSGEEGLSNPASLALLVALAVLVAPYWSVKRQQRALVDLVRAPLHLSRVRWLDLYTFHDPVPGGPLPGTSGTETQEPIASVEVYNEGSFLRDHSSYHANIEEVVRRIFELLDPPRSIDHFAARQLVERRARRVRLRRVLWALAAAMSCALSVPLVGAASSAVGDVCAITGTGLVIFLLIDRLWQRWNTHVTTSSMVHPGRGTPVGSLAWTLGVASTVAFLVQMSGIAIQGVPEADYDGVLGFLIAGGSALTLLGPLVVLMLVSLDHRAHGAARAPTSTS